MPTTAYIALGSNLGDRRAALDAALRKLGETPGIAVRAVSMMWLAWSAGRTGTGVGGAARARSPLACRVR